VWDYDTVSRNDAIGKIYLGCDASGNQLRHWADMLSNPRRPVAQWHTLQSAQQVNSTLNLKRKLPCFYCCLYLLLLLSVNGMLLNESDAHFLCVFQMEQAHSAGAASSTGSLERASLFCASASTTSGSGLSSPVEFLNKNKSSSRFSLFSPPWNSSSESESNPPSRSGSKKLRNYSRRAATGPAGARGPDVLDPKPSEHFQYSEPVISKVTDYIFVGNLNAAYNGRTLCRNNIDSIIDMSNVPGESGPNLNLIPCTCSRGARHSWSRLKVDISDVPDALGDGPALKQRCFEDINECINASTEKKKRVLVHCRDGFSLAPTCIIQYLMVKQNMRLIAAYELLRAKYPVNIRECHQNVLVSLEKALRPGGNVDPECFKQAI
ncbi:hypothetical protein NL108_014331, partial [Boleophthalmus pectinirostris]